MLAIRLQRTGRKGHAMFRVVVQDSRRTPTSGKIVAQLGTYDPHTKAVMLNGEKASFYLTNGAQPSPRAVSLLRSEGVKLPDWVAASDKKTGAIRNPTKLRRNQPKVEVVAEAQAEAPADEPKAAATEVAAPAEPAAPEA
jgi:small subunit ribosomal protein S16